MARQWANYPPELRERAVRMVAEVLPDYRSEWAAIGAVTQKLGTGSSETLRKWVRQARRLDSATAIVTRLARHLSRAADLGIPPRSCSQVSRRDRVTDLTGRVVDCVNKASALDIPPRGELTMRRTAAAAALITGVSALATSATLLLPAAANAQTAPIGGCPGQKFTLQPISANPSSPAHKDINGDGWLCFNGHAWIDNKFPPHG